MYTQEFIDKHRDINIEDYWHEFLLDEFKEQLEIAGFYDIEISYSGFWSQGDGLSFTGKFNNNWIESGEIYYESIKDFLKYIQFKHCYFSISRISHHYYHENTVTISSDLDSREENNLLSLCRDIMKEFYRTLDKEYDYLTSDDAVIESLKANEIIESL